MSVTTLAEVQGQIQQFWSPMFTKELRAAQLLGALVNKDYKGAIKKGGDTVTVSQVNAPNGQLLTVGTDADSFSPEALSMTEIEIKADKRAVASYEFEDLVSIQSLIDEGNSEVMDSLVYAMNNQINEYLYSLVAPSAATPDHEIVSTDMNANQVSDIRKLAGQAKWLKNKPWYGLIDPSYYKDVLDDTTLSSTEYGATDSPVIGGEVALKRFGFYLFEDNSRSEDYGLFFHPDFLHLVQQTEVQVKISDLHSQNKFGYNMSVDLVFGAKLGIAGNVKHIRVQGS